MNTPTDIQIIKQDGRPAFVVIPYHEYLRMLPEDEITVPHEVVELVTRRNMNLVKAWRTYLGLTQAEIAKRAGISQAALSQMEKRENRLRTATLEKLAKALGLHVEQLRD